MYIHKLIHVFVFIKLLSILSVATIFLSKFIYLSSAESAC